MLMYAHASESALRRLYRAELIFHSNVPQLDLATAASTNELSHSTTLHVDVGDPLLVADVSLPHGRCRRFALIIDLDLAVTEPSYKDITRNLIRGQGGDAGIRSGGDFLSRSVSAHREALPVHIHWCRSR